MFARFQVSFIIGNEDNGFAVGRDVREPGVACLVERHLSLFGAVFLHSPHLHQAGTYGVEPDVFSAWGVFGTVVQLFGGGEADFLSAFCRNDVDVIITIPVGAIGKLLAVRTPSVQVAGTQRSNQAGRAPSIGRV